MISDQQLKIFKLSFKREKSCPWSFCFSFLLLGINNSSSCLDLNNFQFYWLKIPFLVDHHHYYYQPPARNSYKSIGSPVCSLCVSVLLSTHLCSWCSLSGERQPQGRRVTATRKLLAVTEDATQRHRGLITSNSQQPCKRDTEGEELAKQWHGIINGE